MGWQVTDDDRKGLPRRMQTSTERDIDGMKAKKEREADAVPHVIEFEDTGVLQGAALVEARAKRSTDSRVAWLETKLDRAEAQIVKQAEWMRSLVLKIIAGIVTLVGAYLAGRHGL
jgi:hypothetical protein